MLKRGFRVQGALLARKKGRLPTPLIPLYGYNGYRRIATRLQSCSRSGVFKTLWEYSFQVTKGKPLHELNVMPAWAVVNHCMGSASNDDGRVTQLLPRLQEVVNFESGECVQAHDSGFVWICSSCWFRMPSTQLYSKGLFFWKLRGRVREVQE